MATTVDQDDEWVLVSHDDDEPEPPYLRGISSYVDGIADSLWPVNKTIHDNPELGFKEHIAHDLLVKFMRSQEGWKVTPSAYGLETAWIAVHDSGRKGPVVSFNVEMDALVGIGHACGHNLIATASLAAGLATASLARQHALGGKVVLFGTPAEEGGGGKIKLLDAGAYRDHGVDLNLISHPGITHNSALMRTTAYTRFRAEFFGREAHAAANPWLGVNALDALVTAYNALSVLRQQTMPGDIIQGHITDGGAAPNIIHAYAAGVFVVRADTRARLEELRAKVGACFEAGATASGARLKVTEEGAYADHVPNRVLARSYTRYFNCLVPEESDPSEPPISRIPLDQDIDEAGGVTRASTDQGDVSYQMPSLSVGFSIAPGPGKQGPHNPEFAVSAGTRDAFERCLRVGKAMAGTALDVLSQKQLLQSVKSAWEKDMERYG
ncbi:hypothetical protein Daus18300_012303 [Diaporthe australafricana]|uniref:Peptidase M20 domain-containing protein 2 n=1 Tax=Diaporthe australafricana TaxID=127596 RepID=A0ABR3W3C4_9PEZI